MASQIKSRIRKIEQEEQVVVCLAIESGSRGWGFPSIDSDYDVRFIYVHRPEWYLSIDPETRRDVIELPIDDVLDINGWDIRKAFKLFAKSNPPLLEWLQCPIVYQERFSLATRLRELMPEFFRPKPCFHHYHRTAQENVQSCLAGEEMRVKRCFYVLRPLLALSWLERDLGPVPMEFNRLVDAVVDDGQLRSAIEELVARKRVAQESGREPRIPAISDFIDREMARYKDGVIEKPSASTSIDQLNVLFRETLDEVWRDGSAV